jgi:hypothetical protein
MTQLDEAYALVSKIHLGKTRKLAVSIKDVLARAQNQPPEGHADGSIPAPTFDALRKVERALQDLSTLAGLFKTSAESRGANASLTRTKR